MNDEKNRSDDMSKNNDSSNKFSEYLMQFFEYTHLPPHLQEISKPFNELAGHIMANLPKNPERTVALLKLLEAKDCAVRSRLM